MFPAPDDFLLKYLNCPCLCQVHRFNDHHLKLIVRDSLAFQIEQKITPLYITAVGEVNPEIEFDAELRLRIRLIHALARYLHTGMSIFHELDRVPIWVRDPCLVGILHAKRNLGDSHAFFSETIAELFQPGDFQTEMPVARANIQVLDLSTPHLHSHLLVEEFEEGCVTAGKVISKRLALLVIESEFDLQAKLVHIEVYYLFQVIGDEVKMRQFSDHDYLFSLTDFEEQQA